MRGMTSKQLYRYEAGLGEAKGGQRKNILRSISRFAPKIGIRGRNDRGVLVENRVETGMRRPGSAGGVRHWQIMHEGNSLEKIAAH